MNSIDGYEFMIMKGQYLFAFKGLVLGVLLFLFVVSLMYYLFLRDAVILMYLFTLCYFFPVVFYLVKLDDLNTDFTYFYFYLNGWNTFLCFALIHKFTSFTRMVSQKFLSFIFYLFFAFGNIIVYFSLDSILDFWIMGQILLQLLLSVWFVKEIRFDLLYIDGVIVLFYFLVTIVIMSNVFGLNQYNTEIITFQIVLLLLIAIWIAANIMFRFKESLLLEKSNLSLRQDLGKIQLISIENERNQIYLELQTSILREVDKLHQLILSGSSESQNKTESLILDIRKYAYNLFPPYFEKIEFEKLIEQELNAFPRFSKLRVQSNLGTLSIMDNENKKVLYRLVQELMNIFNQSNISEDKVFVLDVKENINLNKFNSFFGFENEADYTVISNEKVNLYLSLLKAENCKLTNRFLVFDLKIQ